MKRTITLLAAIGALTACTAQPSGAVAIVDLARLSANWPKFINYQNQLASDADAIQRSNAPQRDKARQLAAVQQRMVSMQNEVARDVQQAAQQVASERHFKLIVTREFVGYGGTDITADVEKILKITEKSPPPNQ